MKKKIIIISVIVMILLMLIPLPLKLKDGGSIEYRAVLYKITKIHSLSTESSTGYIDGWKVNILGFQVYNETNIYVEVSPSIDELNSINNKIIDYFDKNDGKTYDNYSYNYVDEKNKVVIVGLVDNSENQQEWFKKNIIDSKYIKFEQGNHTTNSTLDFYINKSDTNNDIKFNNYLTTKDRKIYLAGNIDEFYILNEDKEETLKYYILSTFQTFDDSIKLITNKLTKTSILRDGGTTKYKSKDKDITIIVCNTIDGNKDVFIGDYLMEYKQDMCK